MTTQLGADQGRVGMTSEDARRLRRRAKISRYAIAEALDISEAAYRKWENGGGGLPWERTVAEVFEAIEAIKARKEGQ